MAPFLLCGVYAWQYRKGKPQNGFLVWRVLVVGVRIAVAIIVMT
ncbi:MAG TPA: hypothetical protein VIO38_05720 [Rariglobus sp.]